MGWELEDVEKPFVEQLVLMGWEHIEGSIEDPAITGRMSFREVIQETVLRERLRAINLRDGEPWLDEPRLDEAVAAITRFPQPKLMEMNEAATALLQGGFTVEGIPGWEGGRGRTIQYLDWLTPSNNRFTVVNQFRVDCPPGYEGGKKFIVPDLVLIVNGLPLVVVECKSPALPEPLPQAVDQLRRYSNQRKEGFEVSENEGVEALFATNQFLIASSFDASLAGTIGSRFEHFFAWKTLVGPDGADGEGAAKARLGKGTLSAQETLVAGMLEPHRLLDIARSFILFSQAEGRTVKLLGRYQQYRAVSRALSRLVGGRIRLEGGGDDERGGIIWHTQGSGKSLTMVFLVRRMREDPRLRRFKVLVITDRRDLQRQLAATMSLSGDELLIPGSFEGLKKALRAKGPGVVFAMIQKYRAEDEDGPSAYGNGAGSASASAGDIPRKVRAAESLRPEPSVYWGNSSAAETLNEDESILVLVDEAHRGHGRDQHAHLMAGLPNAAKIGFTGTPIIMGEKKRTHQIFGEFIDRYTLKASEEDGATVPILYEGRTAEGAVRDGASLDELFEDLFAGRPPAELEAIKARYATKGQVFEAPALIADKARDMLRHYVTNVLPSHLKAQVVAYSRLSALRYHEAFLAARTELLAEAQSLSARERALGDEELCDKPARLKAQVMAWRQRELLERLEFAPVISGGNNDPPEWRTWSEPASQEARIARFKKPLVHARADRADPLAFLIVKSMLLTGFDAPLEGVLYLDRPIREAELLQAVARVNRRAPRKRFGLVVDYYGLARHLKEALSAYDAQDIEGQLSSVEDQLPVLADRHFRVVDLFRRRGVLNLEETEACVELLEDERLFAEFTVKLKSFLDALDLILPRPAALPFVKDAKRLAYIYARARNRFKAGPEIGKDVGAKVRKLIDDHVLSLGIDPSIPPISLTDADFERRLRREPNDRAKASEMEHAIEAHIRERFAEDPILYRRLSERLDEILARLGDNWKELVLELLPLIEEAKAGPTADDAETSGLPELCAPFYRTLVDSADGLRPQLAPLKQLSLALYERIAAEARGNPQLWRPNRIPDQLNLKGELFELIHDSRLIAEDRTEALLDALIAQAKANHGRLSAP